MSAQSKARVYAGFLGTNPLFFVTGLGGLRSLRGREGIRGEDLGRSTDYKRFPKSITRNCGEFLLALNPPMKEINRR